MITNMKKIRIGIDFHGVFNTKPEYFSRFCHDAMARGWEIHIISGGPEDKIKKYLKQYNASYNKIFTILEEAQKLGIVKFFDDKTFHIDDDFWNKAKAIYCEINNIDLHIDDSQEYGKYFSTGFCLYNQQKNICKIKGSTKEISFRNEIENTLNQIGGYLESKS